jgi:hypothetical protein
MNITTFLAIYASILASLNAIITLLKFRKEGELITSKITYVSITNNLKVKGTDCLLVNLYNKGNKTVRIIGASIFYSKKEKISLTEKINDIPKDIPPNPNEPFMLPIPNNFLEKKPKKIEFFTASDKTIKISKRKLNKVMSKLLEN